jgi:hypothetical protein
MAALDGEPQPKRRRCVLSSLAEGEVNVLYRLNYFDTITVLVGPEEMRFTVHKTLICSKSSFFENACSGNWASAQTNTVALSDTKPDVFEAYMHWVYTSNVNMDFIQDPRGTESYPSFRALAQLWIFADMVLDFELCNEVIDITFAISIELQGYASPATLAFIWENISTDSPLCTFHVDIFTSVVDAEEYENYKTQLPYDFKMELASRYMRNEEYDKIYCSPSRRTTCSRYHIHGDGNLYGDEETSVVG